MFDTSDLIHSFDIFSSTILTEYVSDELDCLEADGRLNEIAVCIISFDEINVSKDVIVNKIFLEFIFYLLHIDDIIPELYEIYEEYVIKNNLYDELIEHYKRIDFFKELVGRKLNYYSNTLMFLGWYNKTRKDELAAGFIIGVKNG